MEWVLKMKQRSKNSPFINILEILGKHPIATGIFALVGLLSFIFSIYSATQSSKDTEDLKRSVSDVRWEERCKGQQKETKRP